MNTVVPGNLSLSDLRDLQTRPTPIQLPTDSLQAVQKAADLVHQIAQKSEPVYGINTGFGKLAKTQIPTDQLEQLQTNLVRSHAVGVGPLLDDRIVRLILILKIASLAQGFSGIRPQTLQTLIDLLNAEIYPCIPSQGSVGASGDLAPLAHMSLALMGEGEVRVNGNIQPAAEALKAAHIQPVTLGVKEGLALLNGTQVSTAIALDALFQAEQVFSAALIAGAMSVDAARGSDAPFDPRIHLIRRQPGQIKVAEIYRNLLKDSEIRASHLVDDDRVQDPYSLRCQPQVMGACLDQLRHVAETLLQEANAVSDNPLVFPNTGEVLSGGNFHAEPVALAADALSVALAEVGALSERRIALLVDTTFSGLPPFLVKEPGLNSGFMIAHVTAASLASENKTLAHPASVDSLPTSANQEDHVSMATYAARKAHQVAENVRQIIGIELLCAAQGLDFLRPLKSSTQLEETHAFIRQTVPFVHQDRTLGPDLEASAKLISTDFFQTITTPLITGGKS